MTDHLNSLSQLEEERLTALLAARLEDKASGIGFKPSIRNVITVIMASAEAFIRLLDDVHKKAWDKRDDPDRKKAILVYPSSDAKDNENLLLSIRVTEQFQILPKGICLKSGLKYNSLKNF